MDWAIEKEWEVATVTVYQIVNRRAVFTM